jgi:two-component system response regulator DesR
MSIGYPERASFGGSLIRVGIVEDHQFTRDGLVQSLRSAHGIEVAFSAATAADARAWCSDAAVDVLLLDLHLPDSAGIEELIRSFKAIVPRVIVFTAEARPAFIEAARALPIDGYILKSEPAEALLDAIARVSAAAPGAEPVMSQSLSNASASLTSAEKDLLRLLAQGHKYESIAHLRKTSPTTVKKQCHNLMLKLDIGAREELIAWAAKHGYGDVQPE